MSDNDVKPDEMPTEPMKQADPPKRKAKLSAETPVEMPAVRGSNALKTKLDGLIAERTFLESQHIQHHENLVSAWGTKGADDVALTVATHAAKLAALDTLIGRTEAEYKQAVATERGAERDALVAEHQALAEKRDSATLTLAKARQTVIYVQIKTDEAMRDLEGAINDATTSAINAQRTPEQIDFAYHEARRSQSTHDHYIEDLAEAHRDLYKATTDYLDAYHALLVNERRTAELS